MKCTKKTVAPREETRAALALKAIDEELRDRIDGLISRGTVADRMFLVQVLMQLSSDGHGEELEIASAFETCIRNRNCVVLGASEYEGMLANTEKILERPAATSSVQ